MKSQWGPLAKCIPPSSAIPRGHPCEMYGSQMSLQCKWIQWKQMGGGPPCKMYEHHGSESYCVGPLAKTDGNLCNPKGNPSKSSAKCMTTIEVNPKGAPLPPFENKWKPYEILGYSSATYMEIHWYLKDHLFFQNERTSNELVGKGACAKCMGTTKLIRRGARCEMIGAASEIPMGIRWNPKGCPLQNIFWTFSDILRRTPYIM